MCIEALAPEKGLPRPAFTLQRLTSACPASASWRTSHLQGAWRMLLNILPNDEPDLLLKNSVMPANEPPCLTFMYRWKPPQGGPAIIILFRISMSK